MGTSAESSRERIRQCALVEIEERGIVGLRMANVAKAAGVSVPLIYRYFDDRDGLLANVLGQHIEQFYIRDITNIRRLIESE